MRGILLIVASVQIFLAPKEELIVKCKAHWNMYMTIYAIFEKNEMTSVF